MSIVQQEILRRAARAGRALWAVMAFCFGSALQSQAQVPPPNDNLASAQALVGAVGTVTGTNLYATAQPGEPAPYPGNPAQCSIWYLWTAPFTTTIDFNTRGSTDPYGNQLDTVLAVYRLTSGTNVAFTNLTLVAQNDDDPSGGVVSRVDFRATLAIADRPFRHSGRTTETMAPNIGSPNSSRTIPSMAPRGTMRNTIDLFPASPPTRTELTHPGSGASP